MEWEFFIDPVSRDRYFWFKLTSKDREELWHPTRGKLSSSEKFKLENLGYDSPVDCLEALALIARKLHQ